MRLAIPSPATLSASVFLIASFLSIVPQTVQATITLDLSEEGQTPPVHYGTNSFWTDEDAPMWQERWQEAGLELVRMQLIHWFLEPENDNSDPGFINWDGFQFRTPIPWFGRTVTHAAAWTGLRDAGATLMLNPCYLAGWLTRNTDEGPFSTYPPNDLDEYREYVYAVLSFVVDSLAYPPEHVILDVINEADLGCGQDPAVHCFWDDWVFDDLVDVVHISCEAAAAVSPSIRVYGLAECAGTSLVRNFMDNYSGAEYLSGLTYHRYVSDDFSSAISRGQQLLPYGLPVVINEYGSFAHLSDGVPGALWHSYALDLLWRNEIAPAQFPFSEFVGNSEPYNSMGLFYSWLEDWERKPAYWVYANFYSHFPGHAVLEPIVDESMLVLGARDASTGGALLWVTNRSGQDFGAVPVCLMAFPDTLAEVIVIDNLAGPDPVETGVGSGTPLVFELAVPSHCSRTVLVTPASVSGISGNPPGKNRDQCARLSSPLLDAGVHPNPFRETTRLHWQLSRDTWLRMSLFTSDGRCVGRSRAARHAPGEREVAWSALFPGGGIPLPAGFYALRFETRNDLPGNGWSTAKQIGVLKLR